MWQLSRIAAPAAQAAGGHAAAVFAAVQHLRGAHGLALTPNSTGVAGGPGGRSSVTGAVATVFGATGFIGKYVVSELAKSGTQVVCPFRSVEEKAMPLKQMGDLGQMVLLKDWHLNDDAATEYALSRSNIVINLIGATTETRNFSFDDVHAAWPARLAAMCKANPLVERLVHFSDMGASADSPSARMRSKAAGDEAVSKAFPDATIIRPGPVVGDEDDFFNNLVFQLKFGASIWLPDGGEQPLQPTYVTDVGQAVLAALDTEASKGTTYYLGGPEVLSVKQVTDLMYSVLHELDDNTMYVPANIAKMAWRVREILYKKLPPLPGRNYMLTPNWVDELTGGKVVPKGAPGYQELNITPMKVTEGMAMEPIRYMRHGGYGLGDTKALAKALPEKIKKYYGMA